MAVNPHPAAMGMEAMRSDALPPSPCCAAAARSACSSRRRRRAWGSSARPVGLSVALRPVRSNSVTPSSFSSDWICLDTVDCVVNSCSAASAKPPASATATKPRTHASFMPIPPGFR